MPSRYMLLLAPAIVLAVTTPAFTQPRPSAYELDVVFDPSRSAIEATAVVQLADPAPAADELVFYLHGELEVESIEVAGRPAEFTQERVLYRHEYSLVATRVTVATAGRSPLSPLRVRYAGFFNRSRAQSPSDYMRIEKEYLRKRAEGTDRRGDRLPPENPLLELTPDDIGTYKDLFVLSDRARLFFNWIRNQLGPDGFNRFTRRLFATGRIDQAGFRALLEQVLPGSARDVAVWLDTTDYPEQLHLPAEAAPGGVGSGSRHLSP